MSLIHLRPMFDFCKNQVVCQWIASLLKMSLFNSFFSNILLVKKQPLGLSVNGALVENEFKFVCHHWFTFFWEVGISKNQITQWRWKFNSYYSIFNINNITSTRKPENYFNLEKKRNKILQQFRKGCTVFNSQQFLGFWTKFSQKECF